MSRMDEAIQRIAKALDSGISTSEADWRIIFEECAGANPIETLGNVQSVIAKNFSFSLKEDTVPYAYFGYLDSDNEKGVYKVLADLAEDGTKAYGYISNTQGGKI